MHTKIRKSLKIILKIAPKSPILHLVPLLKLLKIKTKIKFHQLKEKLDNFKKKIPLILENKKIFTLENKLINKINNFEKWLAPKKNYLNKKKKKQCKKLKCKQRNLSKNPNKIINKFL